MGRVQRYALAAAFALSCGSALGQSVFQVQGNTCTFTGATPAPTAVQCPANSGVPAPQVVLTNISSTVDVWVSWGATAAAAAVNAAIPTSTTKFGYYLLRGTQVVVSTPPNAFFTGTTASSTAVVYITPGTGQ